MADIGDYDDSLDDLEKIDQEVYLLLYKVRSFYNLKYLNSEELRYLKEL
jgi:hypothetical protein